MLTLYDLVARQAGDHPSATALHFKGHDLTFLALQERIDQCALLLSSRGVMAGDRFGLVLRNSPEFVITFLALMKLGAQAVPVNFLLKADEITYIFEDAGVVGLMTQPAFLGNILEARKKLPRLREVMVAGSRGAESERTLAPGVSSFEQLMNTMDTMGSDPSGQTPWC